MSVHLVLVLDRHIADYRSNVRKRLRNVQGGSEDGGKKGKRRRVAPSWRCSHIDWERL